MRKITITIPNKQALFHYDPMRVSQRLSRAKAQMEGRKSWAKNGTGLLFSLSKYNIDILKEFYGEIKIINPFKEISLTPIKIQDFEYKTKPYKFQELALKKINDAPDNGKKFALFSDPGTGKSKTAIDYATQLYCEGKIEAVLVVAPKGVHEQWAFKEIPKHCGVDVNIQYWQGPKTDIQVTESFAWFCINYDGMKTETGWDATENFILYHGSFMVIFDESHLVKNKSSKRWKKAYELANHNSCYNKILLTGTPIATSLLDEWAQFYLLDPDIIGMKYAKTFKIKYCVIGGRFNNEIIENINVDEFKSLVEPYIFRARKKDLKDIPKKIYDQWYFKLPPLLRKYYKQVAKELILEIKEKKILDISFAIVKVIKLQQISNGFVKNSEGDIIDLVPLQLNPRIKALKDIIENSSSKKIIIWCRFVYDVKLIVRFLNSTKRIEALPYTGAMVSRTKRGVLERWLYEDDIRFFVATTAAASTGLNLQESGCSHAIYYSSNQKYIERAQSEDRIHRIGAKVDRIIYTDLICRNSRDRNILYNLTRKKTLSQMTLEDILFETGEYI